jgi:hypothetical protein
MVVLRGDGCSSRRCWAARWKKSVEIEQGMMIGRKTAWLRSEPTNLTRREMEKKGLQVYSSDTFIQPKKNQSKHHIILYHPIPSFSSTIQIITS